jgi:RNA polymerase sigma-70 factor (ECF subfamily)
MIEPEAHRAFRELEHRLRPFVARRVGAPADVDDVMQDVFVKMQRSIGEVRDDEKLVSWLFAIARNVIADHHRQRARSPIADPELHDLPADEPGDPEREQLESELAGCVVGFVSALPSPYREAITLTELDGISQKDAAAQLGVSYSGMKSRVQRGRAQLREMFDACCAIELDARRRVVECDPRGGCGPRCA